MSAKTGFAPQNNMEFAVATNENGVVMTSSPCVIPLAIKATCSAEVPLLTATACFVPQYSAKLFSQARHSETYGVFVEGARYDLAKAMADVSKEAAALDGIPVLQVTKMGMKGEGMPPASGQAQPSEQPQAQQPQAQQPPPEKPSVSDAIGGKLGRFGGLGGLGRRKPKEEQPQQQQQQAKPAQQQSPAEPGVLMEMTTESSAFSSAAVDPSKFEVPAGFKQVDARR